MIRHRGLWSLWSCVSLCVLKAAVVATVSGPVGCTSRMTTADWRCHGIGDQPLLSTPAPSAETVRPLASAGEANGGRIKNTGWRWGALYVKGHAINELNLELKEEGSSTVSPWLTAWGYQFEILRGRYGEANTLFQIIPLVVGLEQSAPIPSVSVLAAVRFQSGWEIAGGPHYSPRMEYSEDPMFVSGLGLAASVGYAFGVAELRIPVSFAAVFAGDSETYSLTIGWTLPRE